MTKKSKTIHRRLHALNMFLSMVSDMECSSCLEPGPTLFPRVYQIYLVHVQTPITMFNCMLDTYIKQVFLDTSWIKTHLNKFLNIKFKRLESTQTVAQSTDILCRTCCDVSSLFVEIKLILDIPTSHKMFF